MVYSLAALVAPEETLLPARVPETSGTRVFSRLVRSPRVWCLMVKMSGVVKVAGGLAEDGAEEVVGRGRQRLVQLCHQPPTSVSTFTQHVNLRMPGHLGWGRARLDVPCCRTNNQPSPADQIHQFRVAICLDRDP